ncbi:PASTA domain-containing protein, partial [Nostoc sp. NIES-2111]
PGGCGPGRVVDTAGGEGPPADPGAEFGESLVLVQLPGAGDPVAANTGAQLVVSAALEVEATVEMPSLAGLTLSEARRVLDELGLVLGRVQQLLPTTHTRGRPPGARRPPVSRCCRLRVRTG